MLVSGVNIAVVVVLVVAAGVICVGVGDVSGDAVKLSWRRISSFSVLNSTILFSKAQISSDHFQIQTDGNLKKKYDIR